MFHFALLSTTALSVSVLLLNGRVAADGGIAEMKALTGDAPYLGVGNQEQVPEYFGMAAYREAMKYSSGAAYDGYPSRYMLHSGGGGLYGGGQPPYGAGGAYYLPSRGYYAGRGYPRYVGPYSETYAPGGIVASVPVGSGFYAGVGNEWVNRRR